MKYLLWPFQTVFMAIMFVISLVLSIIGAVFTIIFNGFFLIVIICGALFVLGVVQGFFGG